MFNVENIKDYIEDIILQNYNINNFHKDSKSQSLMNEFFINIINNDLLFENPKDILKSSDFTIINSNSQIPENIFENYSEISHEKNFLKIENLKTPENTNTSLYKAFKYNDFSISYLIPTLQNNEDLLKLQRHLHVFKHNFYIPVVLIQKSNLNPKLMKNLKDKCSLFLILDDEFSISYIKNRPLIHIGNLNDIELFFQTTLYISDFKLTKVRFKIFPQDINKFSYMKDSILNSMNSQGNLDFKFDGNSNCIYFDYDV